MQKPPFTNALVHASSPYLKQHAHNPVDWVEWCEASLEQAKKEKKLLIISVGYAACHWCHVMAHQSFEDPAVAKLMNKHFVCIKVDREERPDIDQIYMMAAQLSTGHGGWPLNVFALPDGRPFYGGTYFPKEQWMEMLKHMANLFETKKAELEAAAEALSQGIRSADQIAPSEESPFSATELSSAFQRWEKNIDFKRGGDQGRTEQTPKFPMPNNYEFLMNYAQLQASETAKSATLLTLDAMALGGIYDHIGGGFCRYSTDQKWLIPHFEKMLYDNGQLIHLYSRAYQWTHSRLYKNVVYQTIDWLEREMMSEEGGFYSSLDADSEGEEGKFYVYSWEEIVEAAGGNLEVVCSYFDIPQSGNFEGKIHLSRPLEARVQKMQEDHVIRAFTKKLFDLRSKRVRPDLDDKIITSWNAMTLQGLVQAYRVFGEAQFLELAIQNAHFMEKLVIGNGINRIVKDGKVSISGFLDDYSFTIEAFIDLYMATFDEKWLDMAENLVSHVLSHFQSAGPMFYYTSDKDTALISRPVEKSDNVISASNSSLAHALFQLGHLLDREQYLDRSKEMLSAVSGELADNLRFYANWGRLYLRFLHPPFEVAILGDKASQIRKVLDEHFIPSMMVLGGESEGTIPLLKDKLDANKTTIYVCRNKTCDLPTTDPAEALKQLGITPQ